MPDHVLGVAVRPDMPIQGCVDPLEVVDADVGHPEGPFGRRLDRDGAERVQQLLCHEHGVEMRRSRVAQSPGCGAEVEQVVVEPVGLGGIRRPVDAGDGHQCGERITGTGLLGLGGEDRHSQFVADLHAEGDGAAAGEDDLVARLRAPTVDRKVVALVLAPHEAAARRQLVPGNDDLGGGQHDPCAVEVPVDPGGKTRCLVADLLLRGHRRHRLRGERGCRCPLRRVTGRADRLPGEPRADD